MLVPLNPAEKQRFESVVKVVMKIIAGETSLEKEEALFGEGHFFWPKDPKKPTHVSKTFRKIFVDEKLQLSFSRKDQGSPWDTAVLSTQS